MLSLHSIPEISKQLQYRTYLKGIVLHPMTALNETASAIFLKINGERTLAEIVSSMAEEYDAPEDVISEDVLALIQSFLNDNVISLKS